MAARIVLEALEVSPPDRRIGGVAETELARLIRAALAAVDLTDESSDEDLGALIAAHLERGTDLAEAVGATLLERQVTLSESASEDASVANLPEVGDRDATLPAPSSVEADEAGGPTSSHTTAVPDLERPPPNARPAAVIPSGTLLRLRPVATIESSRKRSKPAKRRSAPSRRGFATVMFSWVRNIGLILLLFVAWQLWGTGLTEHHAQSAFASEFVRQTYAARSHTTTPRLIPGAPQATPSVGSLVARIQIPAISLSQYVVQGTNESNLSEGPGHYVGTALPGYKGNVAIAGHRTTYGAPFNRLAQVRPGDLIYLTTMSGERFTYRVRHLPMVVSPSDVTVLNRFGDSRLTLTTCNPEFSASQRLVVVGIYQKSNTAATVSTSSVGLAKSASVTPRNTTAPSSTPAVAATTTGVVVPPEGWNWAGLPPALLFGGILILLGLTFRRLLRRFGWTIWFVLVPAWICGLVLLFGAVDAVAPTMF